MASATKTSPASGRRASIKLWVVLGVLLWLGFVIYQTPAVWGAWLMTRATNQLALSGITGSLWKGSASLASIRIDQEDISLGELRWQLQPLSLLVLSPCATVETRQEGQQMNGEICVAMDGSFEVHQADFSGPAALFQKTVPFPIDGQISIHLDQLRVKDQQLQQLGGNVSWGSAQIFNGSNWMPIGSYAAELNGDNQGGVNAKIFHLDGPVQLDLNGTFPATGGGNIAGSLSMEQDFAQTINAEAWLSMFARENGTDAEGRVQYQVETNL